MTRKSRPSRRTSRPKVSRSHRRRRSSLRKRAKGRKYRSHANTFIDEWHGGQLVRFWKGRNKPRLGVVRVKCDDSGRHDIVIYGTRSLLVQCIKEEYEWEFVEPSTTPFIHAVHFIIRVLEEDEGRRHEILSNSITSVPSNDNHDVYAYIVYLVVNTYYRVQTEKNKKIAQCFEAAMESVISPAHFTAERSHTDVGPQIYLMPRTEGYKSDSVREYKPHRVLGQYLRKLDMTGSLLHPYGRENLPAAKVEAKRLLALCEDDHTYIPIDPNWFITFPREGWQGGGVKHPLACLVENMQVNTLYVYCWATDNHVYIGKEESTKHGALVLGQPVKCAGTIRKNSDGVDMVTGESGHYKPTYDDVCRFCVAAEITPNAILAPPT